jgi:hypothetical protein
LSCHRDGGSSHVVQSAWRFAGWCR